MDEWKAALYVAITIAAIIATALFVLPWLAEKRRAARERAKEAKRNRILKQHDPLKRDR